MQTLISAKIEKEIQKKWVMSGSFRRLEEVPEGSFVNGILLW